MSDDKAVQTNELGILSRPLVIGEVLFDSFPDGHAVLGGAPFNVAWHLQGFGVSPLMVSSVGDDKHGERVLKIMQQWGMDTRAMQINSEHPTGQVTVSLQDGQPSYDICADQAYDHIRFEPIVALLNQCKTQHQTFNLLYHGSLYTRTPAAQQTLQQLQASIDTKTFVDVNLRPPWWSRDDVMRLLQKATWVKLNEDE